MSQNGWIGVDLDGTLAEYYGFKSAREVGDPVPAMLDRVKAWLEEGKWVKIFTARISGRDAEIARITIEDWCQEHIGQVLEVTNVKDFGMYELWDDRAVTIEQNTGKIICHPHGEPSP